MSKEKSPAFQFYPRDLLSDLNYQMMNYPERGMYWHLLSLCWLEDSLPSDIGSLARILQVSPEIFESAWRLVGKCFIPDSNDGSRIRHFRLDLERQKQAEWREKSAKGGKASAHKRKKPRQISIEQGGCDLVPTKAQPKLNQRATLLSSSSSSSASPPKSPSRGTDEAYEVFVRNHVEILECPYRSMKADFVQLAALRKAHGLNGSGLPQGWECACKNYLRSELSKFTIADLCSRYPTFVKKQLDRFNKPVDPPEDYAWLFQRHDTSKS